MSPILSEVYFLLCYSTRKCRCGQSGRPEILHPCHEYEYENEYEYEYEYEVISLHFAGFRCALQHPFRGAKAATPLGLPGWRDPYRVRGKPSVLQQPTGYTPSASRSLSSSLREGAKGTSCQREAESLPYGWRYETMRCTSQRKALPLPVRTVLKRSHPCCIFIRACASCPLNS